MRPFIHSCLVHSVPSDGRLVFASSTASRCCNSHFPVPLRSSAAHLHAFLCTISIWLTFEVCVTSHPESTTLVALLLDLRIIFRSELQLLILQRACGNISITQHQGLSPCTCNSLSAKAVHLLSLDIEQQNRITFKDSFYI